MIAPLTRTLTILLIVLLSFQGKSLATIYYVNAANATPGAGTTWATAFTTLNQALTAATGVFDQIWVAKGTYYPTTTTNRAATFSLTRSIPLYGGFNGTETAYTQANPTANPTILSGDIGVPGDPSDNSYHVVTLTNPAGVNVPMDGFTITGGNANQGYPGNTTPSVNNTGGGFLEISITGQMTYASITHCTFTSNFAVYGGGFGVYGDASESFFTLIYCNFTNNSAYIGGAAASLGYNNDNSVAYIDMCVFISNNSANDQGSAIATMNNNGPTGNILTTVTNCVLYNNPQPQLYGQMTNAPGSLQLYTSIIWNSVTPYTGALSAGNSVLIDMCDLDLATPLSSNLDVDPQFTNAAAGDFHTPHCGPLVDQGFTTAGFNMGHTDPNGNPRLLGPKTDIGLYESQIPPPPTVSNAAYCPNATASQLTATGTNLLWYTTIGGASSTTAPIPPTTSAGPTDYYVTQTPAAGCESNPATITVTIKLAATAPTAPPKTYCQNATASPLAATGTNLLWYTTIGGASSTTAPTPPTTSAGPTDYYVTQTPAGSCESNPTTITVMIKPSAAAPTASPEAYCQNATPSPLTASGSNLLWYTTSTGGAGDPMAPTPSTANTGSTTYYVTQTPTGSCESPRTAIFVTIKLTPSSEFTWTPSCEGKATTITASSTTADIYTWDFGNAAATGSGAGPYAVTWVNSNTYPVTLTTTAAGCQGQTQHAITVNPNPKVNIAAITTPLCQGNDIPLEATGATSYQWSPAAGLSNAEVASPVALLQSSIQYSVTGTDDNGCSATAQITLNSSPDCIAYYIPDAFTPNGDGKNDEFRVKTADIPRSFSLLIFNRFGGKVFESSNINNGWNGTVGGNTAPTGTYVYVVQGTTSAGTPIKKQGTVILIR